MGRRARPVGGPSVRGMTRTDVLTPVLGDHRGAVLAGSVLTFLAVPPGLTITLGNVQSVMTLSMAGALALFALLVRRWPVTMLVLSVLSVNALHTAELIGNGWVWPATATLVATVLAGRARTALVVAGSALAYGLVWDLFVNQRPADLAVPIAGAEALWVAAAVAAAYAYRNTRRWQTEVAARLDRDRYEQEREALRRRAEERVDIARDLHDVVSHTLAVVGVHLNVALDAFDTDPEEARDALRLAQQVRGRAMVDLRALVGVLRDGSPVEPVDDLDSVARLAAQVRSAGLDVSLDEYGDRADVPAPVATAVHRVVQESLTNTVRHAGATRVAVTLRYGPHQVVVEVGDNGAGADGPLDGHGIAGMRERVAALGGALTAQPTDTGFTVRATIPVSA